MKNITHWVIFILAVMLLCLAAWYAKYRGDLSLNTNSADKSEQIKIDHQLIEVNNFPDLSAQAVLVGELINDKIVYEKNSTTHLFPASLTKLMSAVIIIDNIPDLDNTKITVSERAVATEGDAGHLIAGEVFYAKDLLKMGLVMSANDAMVVLAEKIGRGKFVGLMNQKASDLGLSNTGFFDPTGFDEKGNFSTAQDLFQLTKYVYYNYPLIGELTRFNNLNVYSLGDHRAHLLISTNELIDKIPNIWLAKTGYTPNANECFLVIYPIGELMFANIILSSEDRFGDTLKVYNWLNTNLKTID